jgi:hypothetical protein
MAADVAAGIAWPAWDVPLLRFATGLAFASAAACAAAPRLASAGRALPSPALAAA